MKILKDRVYSINFKLTETEERRIYVAGSVLVGIESVISHNKHFPHEMRICTEAGILGDYIGYFEKLEDIKDFLPEAYKYLIETQKKELKKNNPEFDSVKQSESAFRDLCCMQFIVQQG